MQDEQYVNDKKLIALSIFKRKRYAVDKAADELIEQLAKRYIEVHKSTMVLCIINAIAVYQMEDK